jgi:hypothetical protein
VYGVFHSHDILILLTRACNIATTAIQIARPEVPERERIAQAGRATKRLQGGGAFSAIS